MVLTLRRTILLCGRTEAPLLGEILAAADPAILHHHAEDLAGLQSLPPQSLSEARLIGFCTPCVVPAALLGRVGFGAYNIHPGTPDYPGWMPAAFALYHEARVFGATAHEMTARVDEGPIIGLEAFEVPPGATRRGLEEQAYLAAARLFRKIAPMMMRPEPPPPLPVAWSGRKGTRRRLAEMAEITPSMPAEEARRRRLAFGEASIERAASRWERVS